MSNTKKLEKAKRAFKREFPNSYCYIYIENGIVEQWLHLG